MVKNMSFLFPFKLVELFTHCLSSRFFHVRLKWLVSRSHNLLWCRFIVFSLDLYRVIHCAISKPREGAFVIWLKISICSPNSGSLVPNITYIIWTLLFNVNLCDFTIISTLWELNWIFEVLLTWSWRI